MDIHSQKGNSSILFKLNKIVISNKYKFEDFEEDICKYYDDIEGSHGRKHIERVYFLCGKIASQIYYNENLPIDLDVLRAAAIYHDISRNVEIVNRKISHAEHGADIIASLKIKDFDNKQIQHISDCVRTHSYKQGSDPETLEAQILYDADKIDSIGAVGIERVLRYSYENKRSIYNPHISTNGIYKGDSTTAINHMIEKILKIDIKSFYTEVARQMISQKHLLVSKFVHDYLLSHTTYKNF